MVKTQQEDETSPLAVAIVRALDPWPGSHYEAYAIVDDLLEEVREAKANAHRQWMKADKEMVGRGRKLGIIRGITTNDGRSWAHPEALLKEIEEAL